MSPDTKRIWPEIIVSGFLHLVWLTLLTLLLFGVEEGTIITFFNGLSAGTGTIMVTLAVGASFLMGRVANRLLTDVSGLVKKPPKESELLDALQKNQAIIEVLEARWASKILYRSVSVSIPLIVGFLLIWTCNSLTKRATIAILIIGLLLEGVFLIAFFTQRKSHADLLASIKKDA
jgi:uncharacterized membrane protein